MTEQIPAEPKNATGQQDDHKSDKASQVQRHLRRIWTTRRPKPPRSVMIAMFACIAVYLTAKLIYEEIRGDIPLLGLENLIVSVIFFAPLLTALAWFDVHQRRKQEQLRDSPQQKDDYRTMTSRIILATLIAIIIAGYVIVGIVDSA